MSGVWGPSEGRGLGLEQGAGPAGCPLCCLQVHQVLHELRGGAGLSEDGKEEEVSTGLQRASGRRGRGGRAGEARPRAVSVTACDSPRALLALTSPHWSSLEEREGSLVRRLQASTRPGDPRAGKGTLPLSVDSCGH